MTALVIPAQPKLFVRHPLAKGIASPQCVETIALQECSHRESRGSADAAC